MHSIDVDPALTDTARTRLQQLGHTPHLAAGDGQKGIPEADRFDRIIATCSVPAIPEAWIEQARPGAIILTDVALGIAGGLVRLGVDEHHRAIGHFTATAGSFMPARTDAHVYPQAHRPERAPQADTRPTALTAADIQAHYPLKLVLAFHLPETELVYHLDDITGATGIQLQRSDGAWARVPFTGDRTVTYGGSPDLWKQAEAAWRWWNTRGRPTQDNFGYGREANGNASVWYIPDGTRWHLNTH
ncbi:methyltransferase domain-containing protein [Streptomyces lasiicapitis]|uniref:hypothetical protein n=1 Tax=Streptomyces lasiicapitis TaxID=1923961 RepID=UPI0036C450F2